MDYGASVKGLVNTKMYKLGIFHLDYILIFVHGKSRFYAAKPGDLISDISYHISDIIDVSSY